jgi:hypothetical protein
MRSESERQEQQPLSLIRDRLDLTILLPVGSEPGSYEVQILDSDLKSRASASASAAIRNFITTLQTTIDLHSLPAGAYQLALRREGEDWRLYPAKIQ